MRWISAIAGLIFLALPSFASAKDKLDPRLQSMMACGSLTVEEARLDCYDQAMLPLKQAMEQGRLVLEEENGPRALEGVVKASGPRGENRYWIELENGERWALLPTTNRDRAPQPGTTVKLRKGLLRGGYWISGKGWQESRADFLGRGS